MDLNLRRLIADTVRNSICFSFLRKELNEREKLAPNSASSQGGKYGSWTSVRPALSDEQNCGVTVLIRARLILVSRRLISVYVVRFVNLACCNEPLLCK